MVKTQSSKSLLICLSALLIAGLSSATLAQEKVYSQDEFVVKEELRSANAPAIACFVDTAAYDHFTQNSCIGFEYTRRRTTTVAFKIFNADPETHSFEWSAIGCSGVQCITSATAYRPVQVDVVVTNNDTGEQWVLVADAVYENGY